VALSPRRPFDANGNSLNDTFRTFTWDADGNPVTIGPVSLTFDALDRMVEQSVSSTNSEIVYSPAGVKLALMNGVTLTKAFVPLTGGATAVYNSSGLAYYRHTDHLGSSRFASTPTQTPYSDTAYSPFGEPYASSGAIDNSFTGQNQDTTAGLYDFLFREQDPNQTRWTSPDPAGLAAVDPSNPQSWNRYAYVLGNPLGYVDPLGFGSCKPGDTSPSCHGAACLNPNAGCVGGPACWAVNNGAACTSPADGPGGGDCMLDGAPTSCGTVSSLSDQGSTGLCLDLNCLVVLPLTPVLPGSGYFMATLALPGFATYAGPCPNGDCRSTPNMIEIDPVLQLGVNISAGNVEGDTLNDRANALAHAINKTGVQSLANPCFVPLFYLTSAVLGGGTAAAARAPAAFAYASQEYPTLINNAGIRFLSRLPIATGRAAGMIALLRAAPGQIQAACSQ